MTERKEVEEIWPEPEWIQNADRREKTLQAWPLPMERRPLETQDLRGIPGTQHEGDRKVSSCTHHGPFGHPAPESALKNAAFLGDDRPVDLDIFFAVPFPTSEPMVKGLKV